jgi:hypothetical protein
MMNLPVRRQITHISPSTFADWKRCQYKVYLKKQSGEIQPTYKSSLAMSIGSAFDAFIKEYIAKKRGIKSPLLDLNLMLTKNIPESLRPEAIKQGRELAKIYIDLGLAAPYLEKIYDIKLEQELYIQINHIPILGQLDMIANGVPFDWKTRGFENNSAYPHKGWQRHIKYNTNNGTFDILEQDAPISMENKNPAWATQLMFYNWLAGNEAKSSYYVHEICKCKDSIHFVLHTGTISLPFALTLIQDLTLMWEQLCNSGSDDIGLSVIEVPKPCKQTCEAYNSVCDVACLCKFYADTLGNPSKREHYL